VIRRDAVIMSTSVALAVVGGGIVQATEDAA